MPRRIVMQQQIQDAAKPVVDAVSVSIVTATLMEWLPPMAALLTVVWTLIRILETRTVRNLCKRWRK